MTTLTAQDKAQLLATARQNLAARKAAESQAQHNVNAEDERSDALLVVATHTLGELFVKADEIGVSQPKTKKREFLDACDKAPRKGCVHHKSDSDLFSLTKSHPETAEIEAPAKSKSKARKSSNTKSKAKSKTVNPTGMSFRELQAYVKNLCEKHSELESQRKSQGLKRTSYDGLLSIIRLAISLNLTHSSILSAA